MTLDRSVLTNVVFSNPGQDDGTPVAGASVTVYQYGTTTPITQVMYATATSSTPLANPLTTDSTGRYTAWIDEPGFPVTVKASGGGLGAAVSMTDAFLRDSNLGYAVVDRYGALGDGATDDYAAILAAYTALPSTGGTLYFARPNATYLMGTALAINKPNVVLRGAAPGTTVKAKASAGINQLVGASTSAPGLRVYDLTFDGNRLNGGLVDTEVGPNAAQGSCILTQGGSAHFEGCEFKGFTYQGILAQVNGHVVVDRCYFHDGGSTVSPSAWGAGFKTNSGIADCKVLNSRFEDIHGTNGTGGLHRGGAVAPDGTEFYFINNYCKNNYNAGGQVADNGSPGQYRGWVIANNTFIITGETAVDATNALELTGYGYTVTGNVMTAARSGGGVGYAAAIVFDPKATGIGGVATISGNTIVAYTIGVYAISTGGGTPTRGIDVIGNIVKDCTQGVNSDSQSTNITVVGNDFTGTTTPIADATATGEIRTLGNTPLAVEAWKDLTGLTWSQGGPVTVTITFARYKIEGKRANLTFRLSATGAGTGANDIIVGGLPAALAPKSTGVGRVVGSGYYNDSGTLLYPVIAEAVTSSTIKLVSSGFYFGTTPAVTAANNDYIALDLVYEIA